jgi:hypothetical protein
MAAAIPLLGFSPALQPGVAGAALLAAFAIDGRPMPLERYVSETTAAGHQPESEPDTHSERAQ